MSGSPPLIGELCEFFALRDFGGSNSPPSVSLRNRARFLQQTAGFVRLADSQAGFGGCCGCSLR